MPKVVSFIQFRAWGLGRDAVVYVHVCTRRVQKGEGWREASGAGAVWFGV